MKRTGLLMCLLSSLVAISAGAQTHTVAPPSEPADSGPSLPATMQFIQTKLSDIKASYAIDYSSGGVDKFIEETSNVIADPDHCRISYHWQWTGNGVGETGSRDHSISLHEVQDIVVEPYEKYLTDNVLVADGLDGLTAAVSPPMTALVVRRLNYKNDPSQHDLLPFGDATLADRVAKALTHAVELCGEGSKDPF